MKEVNVKPTAEEIERMADTMERYAAEMRSVAVRLRLRASNDLSLTAEALTCVRNLYGNLRLDLLVTRPIRELEK